MWKYARTTFRKSTSNKAEWENCTYEIAFIEVRGVGKGECSRLPNVKNDSDDEESSLIFISQPKKSSVTMVNFASNFS